MKNKFIANLLLATAMSTGFAFASTVDMDAITLSLKSATTNISLNELEAKATADTLEAYSMRIETAKSKITALVNLLETDLTTGKNETNTMHSTLEEAVDDITTTFDIAALLSDGYKWEQTALDLTGKLNTAEQAVSDLTVELDTEKKSVLDLIVELDTEKKSVSDLTVELDTAKKSVGFGDIFDGTSTEFQTHITTTYFNKTTVNELYQKFQQEKLAAEQEKLAAEQEIQRLELLRKKEERAEKEAQSIIQSISSKMPSLEIQDVLVNHYREGINKAVAGLKSNPRTRATVASDKTPFQIFAATFNTYPNYYSDITALDLISIPNLTTNPTA